MPAPNWIRSAESWNRVVVTASTTLRDGPGEVRSARCIASTTLVGAFYDGLNAGGVRLTEDITFTAGQVVDLTGQVFTTGLFFNLVSGSGTVNVLMR